MPDFEVFLFMEIPMNEPIKFFNLTLPYELYKELKRLSIKSNKPISQIIRKGISIVLGREDAKNADN